jgi:hypothetical protein
MKFPLPWLQSQAASDGRLRPNTHIEHEKAPRSRSRRTKAEGGVPLLFSCAGNQGAS